MQLLNYDDMCFPIWLRFVNIEHGFLTPGGLLTPCYPNRGHWLVIATVAQSLSVSDARFILSNIVKSDTNTRCMICEKVSFGITDRLLLVDDFGCELPQVFARITIF